MSKDPTLTPKRLPPIYCACASLRRAARLVTQVYSDEMGRDIEPSQFALLSTLDEHPGLSQALLGGALGLDKTTMSRNLGLMRRNGWIQDSPVLDRRERGYALTAAGRKVLSAAKPAWERAQAKLKAAFPKPGDWDKALRVFHEVAETALEARLSQPSKGRL